MAASGVKQTEIAQKLDVHRSVINKQLRGTADISMGRAAEIAWALGYRPKFDLEKVDAPDGSNHTRSSHFDRPQIDVQNTQSSSLIATKSDKVIEYT